jgi:hypothetical protein
MWLFISGLWKAANGLLSMIPPIILALALAGAMATGCIEKTRFDHLTKTVAADKKAMAVADAQAKIDNAKEAKLFAEKALSQTIELQKIANETLAKANQKAIVNAHAASRARTELDRLREQTASDRAKLSNATCEAARQYAATASQLLDQCSREYLELAKKADGHAVDAGMIEAWPVK